MANIVCGRLSKEYLKKTPHTIDISENGRVGVDKFVSGKYDLVLMDMMMPVMDGYAADGVCHEKEKVFKAGRPLRQSDIA